MKTNPNDAAYPLASPDSWKGHLTKREYFAAMAMQGLLSRSQTSGAHMLVAVKYADELIAALNEDKP